MGPPGGGGTWGRRPRLVCAGQGARGAGSRAKTARDPAPLRYVGVRPIDRSPVDGPPSSAHSGQNRGGRTIGPALRAGRAFARIRENQLAATPPVPYLNTRIPALPNMCRMDTGQAEVGLVQR